MTASGGSCRRRIGRRRRFMAPCVDSTCGEEEGVGAEHLGATVELGEGSHGGRHGGLGFGARREKTGKEEDDRERGDEEERGRPGVLSPHPGHRRRRSSPRAGSTARASPGSCLPTEEDDEDRNWAGPCWAVICCTQAAEKRERRKDLGRIRSGKERGKKTISYFWFPCFQSLCIDLNLFRLEI
jgi:hypothetical protein